MRREFIHLALCLLLYSILLPPANAVNHFANPPKKCDIDIDDIGTGPPDPGMEGPFPIEMAIYDFGDDAADLPEFEHPVELRGEVVYPTQFECGPFPIVFIMHGNHDTCFINIPDSPEFPTNNDWPCNRVTEFPLPNYLGYRYLAEILASHGIVTVSISANGINAASPTSLEARAALFQKHLELWEFFSSTFGIPFGSTFINKIDLSRIGLLGHSRGGGAAAMFADLVTSRANHLKDFKVKGPSKDVKAVFLLAPVEGGSEQTVQVTNTALGVLAPYCDGDQQALPAYGYYDASRYALTGDNGPKHSFLVMGANHNFYNKFWDPNETTFAAKDDWMGQGTPEILAEEPFCVVGLEGNGRLSSEEQRGTLVAIASSFFRTYLKNEKAFLGFLRSATPPPPSAMTQEIFIGYHPKDEPESRLDVNRLAFEEETLTNTLGGAVEYEGLTRFEFCDPAAMGGANPPGCLTDEGPGIPSGRVPHVENFPGGSAQLRLAWNNELGGMVESEPVFFNELPADYRDISQFLAFQFRALVDYSDPLNPVGQPQNLRIGLRDGAGLFSSVEVDNYSSSLFYPPKEPYSDTFLPIPHAVLNTVRVPLSAFDDVFLTDIRSVELIFDQTTSGAINVSDLAFADEATNKTPKVSCSVEEPLLTTGGDKLVNVGFSATISDDQEGPQPEILVYSDEDDLDSENNQNSPDAKDMAPETLRLRSERDKNGDGRVYVILTKVNDSSGALGHQCCIVSVSLSNKAADIAAVNTQAVEALGFCTSFAAASEGLTSLPPGFFIVGDGPVIGQDQ